MVKILHVNFHFARWPLTNQGWSSQIDYSPDGSSTLTVKKVAQDSGYEKMRFTHQKKI